MKTKKTRNKKGAVVLGQRAIHYVITREMLELAAAEVIRIGYHPLSKPAIEGELRELLFAHGKDFAATLMPPRDAYNEAKMRIHEFYPKLPARRLRKGEWV